MEMTIVHSISTVMGFVCFVLICAYAYSRRAAPRYEEAARIPFQEEDAPSADVSDTKQG